MKEGFLLIGIITFAYGSPTSLDDLEAYYTHIHHGKKQSPKKVEQLKNQFRQIGIGDTLGSITQRQMKAIASTLQAHLKEPVKGYVANKHTSPFVKDIVTQMVKDGVTKIITFPIKPLHSKTGVVYYQILVKNALKQLNSDIPVLDMENWHNHSSLINVLGNRVKTAWDWLPYQGQDHALVIFTSHSLPGKQDTHHVFVKQFTELASLIAKQANITQWRIAYRSAGTHGGPWLGPDIKEVIEQEAQQGCQGLVVCELLSLTSNVETTFDIRFDIQPICRKWNIEFFQTAMLDDSFDFIMALKQIVLDKMALTSFLSK